MAPKRSRDVTYEVVDGRAILIDPDGRELLTLNPTGTIVWEHLDGSRDGSALVDALMAHFPDVDRPTLAGDVEAFISELRASALIEDGA